MPATATGRPVIKGRKTEFFEVLMSVFKGFSWAIKPGQGEGRGVSCIGFRGG